MNNSKAEIRKSASHMRETMDELEAQTKSDRICQHIIDTDEYGRAKTVLLYSAIGREVCLDKLIEHSLRMGKKVLLPVCGNNGIMDAYRVESLEQLKLGKYGIAEPDTTVCVRVEPAEIDYIAVPGVAFDKNFGRIGRGAGYYDKYLPLVGDAYMMGVSYQFQIYESIPVDEHDYRMNAIVCEEGILRGDKK